jgi:tetratricopeptide (TPR) repeat protein
MSIRVLLGVLVGLVAVTGAPRLAWTQKAPGFERLWYQAYDEGVRAVQRGDWATAIPALEAAKRGGPAPGRRVLFQGDRVDVFNPDYYLGLAYNATKRFNEADAAFARVASANLIGPTDRLYDELRKQTARASYERVLTDGERALRAGRLADVEKLVAGVIGSLADDGRAGELAKRAKDETAQLASASANNAPVANALPPVVEQRPTDQPPAANDPKLAANDPKTPAGEPTKGVTPVLPPRNNPPQNSKESDAKNAGVAVATRPATPAARPPALLGDSEAALLGATAYFQGRYDEAVRILTPAFQMSPPSNLVTFYLAASKAALVAAGRADRATLTEAREMFSYAVGGGPLDRHLRYISPRVREMLGDIQATAR